VATKLKTKKEISSIFRTVNTFINFFYCEISLLIGSSSNYAGDGPKTRINSLDLNGIKIVKSSLRYYITEINKYILDSIFPNNNINIGDEVIQLNYVYCEHIGNVTKYTETNEIRHIQLRSKICGQQFDVVINQNGLPNTSIETHATTHSVSTSSSEVSKRRRINCKTVILIEQ